MIQCKWFTRFSLLAGALALPMACFGQNVSKGGRFSADVVVGCAPLTVNITPLDNFGNISRQYIYEENSSVTNSTTHTFTKDTVYNIVQIVGIDVVPKTDTLTIVVHPPDTADVQIANCRNFAASVKTPASPYDYYWVHYTTSDSVQVQAGDYATPHDYGAAGSFPVRVKGFYNGGNDACGEVSLSINTLQSLTQPTLNSVETFADNTMLISASLNPGISYVLQVSQDGGATFSEIPVVFQGTQLLVDQLDPLANSYCFRLAAFDPCNSEFYYSNLLCSVGLETDFEEYRNNLRWTTPAGTAVSTAVSWEVVRNGSVIAQAGGVADTFADSSLICNTDYCYQVRISYPSGFALSQEVCGTSFENQTLLPVTDIYSTYQNDELLISWQMPQESPSALYKVLYSSDGSNLTSRGSFTSDDSMEVFAGSAFLRSSNYYTIVYSDECGNESPPGPLTRPIFLTSRKAETNTYNLSWNQYLPLTDGVRQYFVELWDQNMEPVATFPVWDPGTFVLWLNSEFTAAAWVTVRAEGAGADTGFTSRSNRAAVEFKVDLYVPTAFTPNGDGLNDELAVAGLAVTDFFFSIYNRWGELVFATSDQTLGWDGTFRGKPVPQGSYHYFVEGRDEMGNLIKKSGNFVLLRN